MKKLNLKKKTWQSLSENSKKKSSRNQISEESSETSRTKEEE